MCPVVRRNWFYFSNARLLRGFSGQSRPRSLAGFPRKLLQLHLATQIYGE